MKVQWSPTIELGQIVHVVLVVVGVASVVVPAYVSMRTDQATADNQIVALAAALAAANSAADLRITADEHRMDVTDERTAQFRHDQAEAMSKITDALSDLKAVIAGYGHRR
jgi:Na+-transporting NADH:ubiquinone oxidoreductase subunit NqrC